MQETIGCTTSWHCLPEEPILPEGQDYIILLAARKPPKGKEDQEPQTWACAFNRGKGFSALKGHPLKGVYAWSYLPNAPEIK